MNAAPTVGRFQPQHRLHTHTPWISSDVYFNRIAASEMNAGIRHGQGMPVSELPSSWNPNQMPGNMRVESHMHPQNMKGFPSSAMRPHSQTTDSSTSAQDSDNSSDPAGHDLGFLDLSPESTNTEDTSQSQSQHCSLADLSQNRERGDSWTSSEHRGQDFDLGEDMLEQGKEKRRRGRPVGSKDRQPRVKRIFQHEQEEKEDTKEGGRRKPWKIILTAEQAVEIYRLRPLGDNAAATSSCKSNEVAEQYGVNSKTIRDIWNRTTWVKATRGCWTEEEEEDYLEAQARQGEAAEANKRAEGKKIKEEDDRHGGWGRLVEEMGEDLGMKRGRGRPKGAVDTRPRLKRRMDGAGPGQSLMNNMNCEEGSGPTSNESPSGSSENADSGSTNSLTGGSTNSLTGLYAREPSTILSTGSMSPAWMGRSPTLSRDSMSSSHGMMEGAMQQMLANKHPGRSNANGISGMVRSAAHNNFAGNGP